jgi:hypothetical protein
MTFRKSLIVALSASSCLTLVLSLACLYILKTNSSVMPTDQTTLEEAKWLAEQWVSVAQTDIAMSELDAELRDIINEADEDARRSHQALRASPEAGAFFEKLDRPLSLEQEAKFKRLMSVDENKVNSNP